jgi:leader peptidase (prepilin peptidase)/N-methyltransferase
VSEASIPAWFWSAAVGAYGLVFGSFLNVVIYRVPREISLLRPRSHCPSCDALVRWYDNVPVLSYLWLLGRCRDCRARISPRYPLVELATAAVLLAVWHRFGATVVALEAAVLVMLLLPLALIDLEHHLLPDVLTLPGIVLGLAGSACGGITTLFDAAVGAVLGAALPYLVIVTYRLIRGAEGMGLGDVKLLAMVGAFLGWRGTLLTLALGATAGAIVGIGLIVAGRGKGDTELPFGTFLALAAGVTLFFAADLVRLLGWARP